MTRSSDDPSWGGAAVTFPQSRGRISAARSLPWVGSTGAHRQRVITDNWLRDPADPLDKERLTITAEHDGAAEYATIPATNALAVDSRCPMPSLQHSPALFHGRGHADPRGCLCQIRSCSGRVGRCRRGGGPACPLRGARRSPWRPRPNTAMLPRLAPTVAATRSGRSGSSAPRKSPSSPMLSAARSGRR